MPLKNFLLRENVKVFFEISSFFSKKNTTAQNLHCFRIKKQFFKFFLKKNLKIQSPAPFFHFSLKILAADAQKRVLTKYSEDKIFKK